MITAAGRMLWQFGKGALRQTKHLSPWKRRTGYDKATKKLYKSTAPNVVGKKELRPWAKTTLSGMKKVGFSKGARTKALYGYTRGTKHIAKHKKLYGAGVTGAAAWDILDRDD
jgi:hypothetical protein